jgi:shikimate dehydrogenase
MGVKKFAVLGDPVDHSLSPSIHQAAYEVLGLDWSYSRIRVPSGHLEGFLVENHEDYSGFSLTMPLKEELLSIARERDWKVEASAIQLGSANTLFVDSHDEKIAVANTDLVGAIKALETLPQSVASVAILGSGATARTVAMAALSRFSDLGTVTVFSRRQEPAQKIAELVEAGRRNVKFEWLPIEAAADFGGADLTVNTLPTSVSSQVEVDLPFGASYFFDVTYDSNATSPAMSWPLPNRVDARTMLVYQAVEQLRLFGAFREGNPNVTADQVAEAMFAVVFQH